MRRICKWIFSRHSFYRLAFGALICFLSLTSLHTQDERRVALVIGNGAYAESPLKNPINDAKDIAAALEQLGFAVTLKVNLNQNDMKRAIDEFGQRIKGGGVGLFYFAGHGVQAAGRNYLIPVGTTIAGETDVDYEAVEMGRILAKMEDAQNRLNILILDACRNNPFARSFRSETRGLAVPEAGPKGSLIAFATAPGRVASDGDGRNSIYTEELLRAMRVPGLPVEEVFKQVRANVARRTKDQQTPWESSSLVGRFSFRSAAEASPGKSIAVERETVYGSIAVSTDRAGAEIFLDGQRVGLSETGTRLRLRNVPAGDHTITASAEGKEVWRGRVEVAESAEANVQIVVPIGPRPAEGGTNSLGMFFVPIAPGSFEMGSYSGNSDEKPAHRVTISQGFQMQATEVTQGQWQAVIGSNPSYFKNCGKDCPVEQVSWEEAKQFIGRLNERSDGWEYRLPTEAEWEYACRAGTTGDFAGNLDSMAWYGANSGSSTHPVGKKQPNSWGLYDMHGNVWEWVEDWYGRYSSGPATDPRGPSSGSTRVSRGGSCRSAHRGSNSPVSRGSDLGFRLVRTAR